VSRVCLDLLSNMMLCLSSNKITGSTSKLQLKSKSGVQNIAKKRKQRCMHEGTSVMHVLYSMKISIMDRISKQLFYCNEEAFVVNISLKKYGCMKAMPITILLERDFAKANMCL
jgi:hypothetical protein